MPIIEINNLSFGYSSELNLANINLEYNLDDFLAILGPNGGGKSTLLRLILGLLEPSSGSINVFGKAPKYSSTHIGYVPQNTALNANFPISVLEVVLMGIINEKIFGFYTKSQISRAYNALEQVGMADFAKRKISDLSGGQRQRVFIARALISNTKLLLLDEPTTGIDTKGQAGLYEILSGIHASGVGVVVVSHDVPVVLSFATKAAYVNKTLFMHKISTSNSFLSHLKNSHEHFCDIELTLKQCSCEE